MLILLIVVAIGVMPPTLTYLMMNVVLRHILTKESLVIPHRTISVVGSPRRLISTPLIYPIFLNGIVIGDPADL